MVRAAGVDGKEMSMVSSWVDGPNILLRNSYVDSTMIPPYPNCVRGKLERKNCKYGGK